MALLHTKRWEGWRCRQVIGAISKLILRFLEQWNRIPLSVLGCPGIECELIWIVEFWILLGIKYADSFLLPFVKRFQIIKATMEVIKFLLQSLCMLSAFRPLPMTSSVNSIYNKWRVSSHISLNDKTATDCNGTGWHEKSASHLLYAAQATASAAQSISYTGQSLRGNGVFAQWSSIHFECMQV